MTKENTLRSGCRGLSTKDLTEPTLLEISGKGVNQDLEVIGGQVRAFGLAIIVCALV
jgi:hypothetical protein